MTSGTSGAVPSAIAGIGVDLVDVGRVRTAVERTPTLVERLFTAAEQRDCRNVDGTWRYPRMAARFAAKEAVAKALGTGIDGFSFPDVEVVNNVDGRPDVVLHPAAARVAAERGVAAVHLSLSHTATLAVAQAVAERAILAP